MTSVKNRERILEAIDQLRRRKARPDIQRICNYLFRKYSISSAEARGDLQWCVDHDIVLKVEYKGNTSYRNAAKKYPHIKRIGLADNSATDSNKVNRKFGQLLTNAFGELVVGNPDYLEVGVPAEEIIENILSKDSVRYTKNYIKILLEKEVENGGLIRMENGNYEMGPITEEERKADNERIAMENREVCATTAPNHISAVSASLLTSGDTSKEPNLQREREYPIIHVKPRKRPGPKPGFRREKSMDNNNCENSMDSDERKSENGSIRVGGRRKRAKKVFDPSDSHIPKKRGRPAGSLNKTTLEKQFSKLSDDSRPNSRTSNAGRDHGGVCSVCHLQNKKDSMVACRECSNKAHYSCLNGGDDMMLRMYPDNTWQCPHCKTCVTCDETSDAGNLTVCSVCSDAYHAACHDPRITSDKTKNGRWSCMNCQASKNFGINEIQSNIGHSFSKVRNVERPPPSDSDDSGASNYNSRASSPLPPQLSPQRSNSPIRQPSPAPDDDDATSESRDRDSDYDENIDPSIPDASNWTYEEVYQYFAQYFPEHAKVFREQEIDGRSLLLMTRMDVLKNLKLKLGPALKIYKHVVKLQVRKDDPKYYWL